MGVHPRQLAVLILYWGLFISGVFFIRGVHIHTRATLGPWPLDLSIFEYVKVLLIFLQCRKGAVCLGCWCDSHNDRNQFHVERKT